MPTPPYAQLTVAVNGGAAQTGAITVTSGQSIQLGMGSTSGVYAQTYEIYSYPPSYNPGAGWSLGADGYTWQSTAATPPAFNTGTAWGKFLLRLRINGNPLSKNADSSPNTAYQPALTDESTALTYVSPTLALRDLARWEDSQFSSTAGFVADQAANLRAIETFAATGSGAGGSAHLVTSGQTYTMAALDSVIIFDTSGGTTATAQMVTPAYIGQRWTFYWWNWNPSSPVAPTILTPAGTLTVPASGQTAPGNAGLVSTTTMPTPGGSFCVVWDGTRYAQAGIEGGALVAGAGRITVTGPSCSVAGVGSVLLTGSTLTDMTNGKAGQIVEITIQNAASAVTRAGSSGSKFALSGSQNCTAAAGYATLTVVYEPLAGGGSGAWCEMSRSTDNG